VELTLTVVLAGALGLAWWCLALLVGDEVTVAEERGVTC
jgi:hypothetical protein